MLYAENYIDTASLKRWTADWNESQYIFYFKERFTQQDQRKTIQSSMESTIVQIKKLCRKLPADFDFHSYLQLMNPIVFDCYFKASHSALEVANYYEEVLLPADAETQAQLLGVDEKGQPLVQDMPVTINGHTIGSFGRQSDLFQLVFNRSQIREDHMLDGQLTPEEWTREELLSSLYQPYQEYISLKIWRPDLLAVPPAQFVESFLFYALTHQDLHLKRIVFDRLHQPPDPPTSPPRIDIPRQPLEALPLLYFNAGAHNLPPPILYLSYYRVIEYFMPYVSEFEAHQALKNVWMMPSPQRMGHLALDKVMRSLETLAEAQAHSLLRLIEAAVSETAFKSWLQSKSWLEKHLEDPRQELPHVVPDTLDTLHQSLASRVAWMKNILDPEPWIFHQGQPSNQPSETLIRAEIPLIQWLAARILSHWSERFQNAEKLLTESRTTP